MDKNLSESCDHDDINIMNETFGGSSVMTVKLSAKNEFMREKFVLHCSIAD